MRHPGKVLAVDVLASSIQINPTALAAGAPTPARLMVDPLRPPLIEVINGSAFRFLGACAGDAAAPPT